MLQAALSAPLTVQLKPPLLGSVSESETLRATPAPALFTTIVKPIVSPALTGDESLVLVTVKSGQRTVMSTAPEELLLVLAATEIVSEFRRWAAISILMSRTIVIF